MNKTLVWGLILLLIGGAVFILTYSQARDYLFQYHYDQFHENENVKNKKEINAILKELPKVSYNELTQSYLNLSWSDQKPFKSQLQSKTYFKVQRKDLYKKIVGHIRIKDLMTKDAFYKECLYKKENFPYWLIDRRLLYKINDLQQALKKSGYDPNAFWIRFGHRHPQMNKAVNGANASRHIYGEAADLVIQDINRDGRYTAADKAIILELVDNKIIGDQGGVGRYPGTRTVHIDVRGQRARWDSY